MPGPNAYREPEKSSQYEQKIKRSVFIAEVHPCHDEQEARAILADVISQHRDATHNCRAYILSDGTEYSSDDGEPSGTAGRPILNAIKHSGLVNVIVVVTRYYGGVKLGVRGLIDAYGDTAMNALELCGNVERVATVTIRVAMSYNSVGNVSRLLEGVEAVNLRWNYAEGVSVLCDVPEDECERLAGTLDELKARGIIAEWEKIS